MEPSSHSKKVKFVPSFESIVVRHWSILANVSTIDGALAAIADWWNSPGVLGAGENGGAFSERFEFETDGHTFTVTVEPTGTVEP